MNLLPTDSIAMFFFFFKVLYQGNNGVYIKTPSTISQHLQVKKGFETFF